MSWTIYKHTNKINNKCYIGQTKRTVEDRWGKNGINYLYKDTHFANAIKKYGWDNFWHEIIEEDIETLEEANRRETYWIKFYDSVKNGYNSNYGGDCHTVSDEVREKFKQRTGEKNPFYGKHHSLEQKEEYRKKIGKKVICLETKVEYESATYAGQLLGVNGGNIRSACRLGINVKIANDFFHFYYKDEVKPAFISSQVKKVYNVETNEIFNGLISAGKSINKSSKLIGMACRGKVQTAGGYHWAYLDDWNSLEEKDKENKKQLNILGKGRKKKVKCIELNTIYDSQLEASRITGIGQQSISKAVNGKQRTAGGYHWEIID